MIDGGVPRCRAPRECIGARRLRAALAADTNRVLQSKQQTVEIDRHDFGGVDRGARAAVSEPARTEIPAAFRSRPNVAKHLSHRAAARLRKLRVFPIGLIARAIAIVPIAIEYRSVRHGYHAPVRAAGPKPAGPLHPECIFALEL